MTFDPLTQTGTIESIGETGSRPVSSASAITDFQTPHLKPFTQTEGQVPSESLAKARAVIEEEAAKHPYIPFNRGNIS